MCIRDRIQEEQVTDQKLAQIRERILNKDLKITPFYQLHKELIFTKPNTKNNQWKLYIPKSLEQRLIEN